MFTVPSGRIDALAWGTHGAPLVLCVPGLSQDARSFAPLGSSLGSDARHVVSLSPRGRGLSDATPEGTYGWPAHARDVIAVADALGAPTFDYVGWSFGGLVGMQLASIAPERVRRLVLVDVIGRPDLSALGPIMAGLERLTATYDSPEDYADTVLASGAMDQQREVWREYLLGDLVPSGDGFVTRTNHAAVIEDATYGGTHDVYELWPSLTMPVLLVRASREIMPGLGYVVTAHDAERLPEELPDARVVEIDANHYCVGHLPETAKVIATFLDAG